jgi:hypothetical protein
MPREPLDKSVIDAISDLLRGELTPFGLRDVTAVPGEDHDGDPVIFVHVDYVKKPPPVDVRVTSSLVTKLHDRLWDLGETRFPHIRHNFAPSQKVVGI